MLHPFPPEARDVGPLIELKNVTCGYDGRVVLSNVNISIMSGDFVGLLGPSGSGKTTLLRAILGAVDIYGGEVCVAGVPVVGKHPRAGYVPQLDAIDWNFPVTVEQVVMMGRTMEGGLFPWFKGGDRDAAHAIMERLGIGQVAKRPIRDLSGGQQRRVFLARALVSSPHLLLLDEPTSGADIKTRDEILHLLDELNHQNVTVVMSTHELNAVAAHLPWVVCVNGGVVAEGPPSEVFTAEILKATYNAEMPVVQHDGMTLVGERPHFIGRHSHSRGRTGVPAGEDS